jgi:putative transposase
MQTGHRYRCYPTPAQAKVLLQWIGCQRYIYNAKVQEDRYFRRFARQSLTHTGQYPPIDQQYSQFKTEDNLWLKDCPSQILRNAAYKWKEAYSRFFKKLGGRPTIHKKHGKQSVFITKELFTFTPVVEPETGEIKNYLLNLGTIKTKLGLLDFKAHNSLKDLKPPASIHISVHAGRWHLSFNSDDSVLEPSEVETVEYLMQHSETELLSQAIGLDRGVNIPLATSDSRAFGFTDIQLSRLFKQDKHRKRWQKRLARCTKGSNRREKAKRRAAGHTRYAVDVRRDVAHKTSHALAADDRYKLFVFEDLKVRNMTATAKGTVNEPGKMVRQKAGLNRSILGSMWGQTHVYLSYKAKRKGKLCISIAPHYSSQECAACGYIHKDNRPDQATFVCQSCKNTDHADHNAGKVIAKRGVQFLLSGAWLEKKKAGEAKKQAKQGRGGKLRTGDDVVKSKVANARGDVGKPMAGSNTTSLRSLNRENPSTGLP